MEGLERTTRARESPKILKIQNNGQTFKKLASNISARIRCQVLVCLIEAYLYWTSVANTHVEAYLLDFLPFKRTLAKRLG